MRIRGKGALPVIACAYILCGALAACVAGGSPRRGEQQPDPSVYGPWVQATSHTPAVISWYSSTEAPGKVEYELAGGKNTPTISVNDAASSSIHHVSINGLKPGTAYRYRIETGGWRSPWYTFRTAPEAGRNFRFVAYGDTRSQPDVHARVVKRILQFHPELVVQTGDLVADGRDADAWGDFWRVVAPMVSSASFMPALGNHERNAAWYFRFFGPARDYSFDYGSVHFSVLDTNRPPSEYAAQDQWLKEDLARSRKAAWHVLICHHTPVTCVADDRRRIAADRLRARLEPLLKEGHVQVVFSGHDHNYQRHEVNGITYVVTGGGGAPLYDLRPDTPYVKVARKAYNECEVLVSGDTMRVRAVDPDGAQIDAFTLHAQSVR